MWCTVSHFVKIHMLRLRASDLGIGDVASLGLYELTHWGYTCVFLIVEILYFQYWVNLSTLLQKFHGYNDAYECLYILSYWYMC